MSNCSSDFVIDFVKKYAFCIDIHSYCAATGQPFESRANALAHYVGAGESAAPELLPSFDAAHYESQLAEGIPPGVSPLRHYVEEGVARGLTPYPLFDAEYVRSQVEHGGFISIFEYLADSRHANIDPHPLFSKNYYRNFNFGAEGAAIDPFWHYIVAGWKERRPTHPFFRYEEYKLHGVTPGDGRAAFNQHLAVALESPNLASGYALFDADCYIESCGDGQHIKAPLQHYLRSGWRLDAAPHPLFDPSHYAIQSRESAGDRRRINPYTEYLSDFSHRHGPNIYFNPDDYRISTDVNAAYKGSLLEHFLKLGAARGARPWRQGAMLKVRPSRRSGFEAVQSVRDAAGVRYWHCVVNADGVLSASIEETSEIEPALTKDTLGHSRLHSHSLPPGAYELSLIAVVGACARCNCLVVSDEILRDELVSRLLESSTPLVSSGRPWLTLMSVSNPNIRYWHKFRRCLRVIDYRPPKENAAAFIAKALVASMPVQLVVHADRFGVELLRNYGTRLLAVCSKVTLFASGVALDPHDSAWLSEFVTTNFAEFHALIDDGDDLQAPRTAGERGRDSFGSPTRLYHPAAIGVAGPKADPGSSEPGSGSLPEP
ncbi:hypothetical protein GJ654_11520 [Rhodoblastus acidophilus]|uniref:Uncharacterized protein n=1 Tax=Rhodoblastus acidophilus TaxID=1074 RepID=A0A6N8DR15_RHOAC|nr:hypothetical protein [Rhodoblastus acidophilus]MCW2274666.1 hypothetical protein [Rhodoblastus acidophilus]MTV31621.1 hypothetical protein [Rhodoblastus acidophilus]